MSKVRHVYADDDEYIAVHRKKKVLRIPALAAAVIRRLPNLLIGLLQ